MSVTIQIINPLTGKRCGPTGFETIKSLLTFKATLIELALATDFIHSHIVITQIDGEDAEMVKNFYIPTPADPSSLSFLGFKCDPGCLTL